MPRLTDLPVYVVNLDSRPERWESAQKILRNAGFTNIQRVSAIDGRQIDSKQLKTLLHPEAYHKLGQPRHTHEEMVTLGAAGCYLSHYKIWGDVLLSGQPAVIAEDDLVLHNKLHTFPCVQNANLLQDHDMTLLGYSALRERVTEKPHATKTCPYPGLFFGTHFYHITPNGARLLLEHALPMRHQVDAYMGYMARDKKINLYIHNPNLSWQDVGFGTDAQTFMHSINLQAQMPKISSMRLLLCLLVLTLLVSTTLLGLLLYQSWK